MKMTETKNRRAKAAPMDKKLKIFRRFIICCSIGGLLHPGIPLYSKGAYSGLIHPCSNTVPIKTYTYIRHDLRINVSEINEILEVIIKDCEQLK